MHQACYASRLRVQMSAGERGGWPGPVHRASFVMWSQHNITPSLRGFPKRWTLGCANSPARREAVGTEGGITQPRTYLIHRPCSYMCNFPMRTEHLCVNGGAANTQTDRQAEQMTSVLTSLHAEQHSFANGRVMRNRHCSGLCYQSIVHRIACLLNGLLFNPFVLPEGKY